MRLWLAFKCFFLVLFARRLPEGAAALLPRGEPAALPPAAPPPTEATAAAEAAPAEPPATERGAVQLLTILQREGRLIDFLLEEIDAYGDAQIGAAVRDIHRGCKKALAEHLPLEPVLREQENATVRIDPGFDPSRIRLVGKVVGEPPFTGTLRHHGWRIAKVSLPTVASDGDASVVTPAEVELA